MKQDNILREVLIDLMRHGEPRGGRRYRGQTDDPLSEKGWQQMWDAVGDYRGWQHIVTSPLLRCAAFANALAERIGVGVTHDERLQEVGFGEWEGKLPAEICADDPYRLFRFRLDPLAHAPQDAEPLLQFHARVGAAWRDMASGYLGNHVLEVGHAGVIRMILAHALDLSPQNVYRINISNAAFSRIRLEWSNEIMLPTLLFHEGDVRGCR